MRSVQRAAGAISQPKLYWCEYGATRSGEKATIVLRAPGSSEMSFVGFSTSGATTLTRMFAGGLKRCCVYVAGNISP